MTLVVISIGLALVYFLAFVILDNPFSSGADNNAGSSNPALPPLERQLQQQLLNMILEFSDIARQLDALGVKDETGKAWIYEFKDMWGDAQTEAFAQITSNYRWI